MSSPSVISVVLHLGLLVGTGKDILKGVQDLIAGHPSKEDLVAILKDVVQLFKSGLLEVPGLSGDQIAQIAMDIEVALDLVAKA